MIYNYTKNIIMIFWQNIIKFLTSFLNITTYEYREFNLLTDEEFNDLLIDSDIEDDYSPGL
uniref:Uncharacterized protein n=1 Tax=viral metagenome TaxID=1070528 RepID=A0A6C0IVF1_9ZZZZ